MRTDAFRAWLKDNKKNVEDDAIACCRRVEKALGNLDKAFDADGLDSMIEHLNYTKADERANRLPPEGISFKDGASIRNGMAALKKHVCAYRDFRQEQSCSGNTNTEPQSDGILASIVGLDDRLQLDTPIYRYLSMEHFLDMIENKRNVLMHVSYWDDPFEAFLFRGGIASAMEEGENAGNLYDAFKFLYGQSWTFNDKESDVVWRAMGKRGTVVRIQSTVRKLAASVLSQGGKSVGGWRKIARVRYLPDEEFNSLLTHDMVRRILHEDDDAREICLFRKREAFGLEDEVRLVIIPQAESLDRNRCVHGGMLKLDIEPGSFIEAVFADPAMSRRKFEQLVCRVRHVSPEIDVEQSGLFAWPCIPDHIHTGRHDLNVARLPEGHRFYDYLIARYHAITDNAYNIWSRVQSVFRAAEENGMALSQTPTFEELVNIVTCVNQLIPNPDTAANCKTAVRHYMHALYGRDDRA